MAEDKATVEKINQLQVYEQSLQNMLLQKQQFQSQINEIDSALKELEDSSQSFKIIGNIMVKSKKEDLKKDLESRKSALELRTKTFEKQEESIKEKTEKIRAEVMENMQGKE